MTIEKENFLHILAVIPLRTGQSEEPFFQDRIAPIPKGEGETKPLLVIRDYVFRIKWNRFVML